MNDLTLLNSDLDLDLTLLDDEAFAEILQRQWYELLTEQSTLALL